MRCPRCERLPTAVLKTIIPIDEKLDNTKKRRRACRNCDHSFHTFEITEDEFRKLYPDKLGSDDVEVKLKDKELRRTPLRKWKKDNNDR